MRTPQARRRLTLTIIVQEVRMVGLTAIWANVAQAQTNARHHSQLQRWQRDGALSDCLLRLFFAAKPTGSRE